MRGVPVTSEQKRDDLFERVVAAHRGCYDIIRDYQFEGRIVPAFASFHSHGEQYVLVKRAKMWEVETHDYLFLEKADHLTAEALEDEIAFVIEHGMSKVIPGPNHMSSGLSLVVVATSADDEALKLARKAKFRKNFKLSLHGWADLRVAVCDLSREKGGLVVSNAVGRGLAKMLKSNLELSNKNQQER